MIHILFAEWKKSHKTYFNNPMVYFSLFIWPALLFATSYYSYKPFDLSKNSYFSQWMDPRQIGLFLLTGYLAYNFFWSLVQSAWQMSYERQSGTLEIIFLTPVSRLLIMYSRAFSNLFQGVWIFAVFSCLATIFVQGGSQVSLIEWLLSFLLLTASAIIWGGFLNVLFLFSRDSGILYTILEEPMQFFSGVKLPIAVFPLWAKFIAFCFPLTYVLDIMRKLTLESQSVIQILPQCGVLFLILGGLVLLSSFLVSKAEKHAKKTGSFVLF